MANQEELILKTLFEIKESIGGLDAKIESVTKRGEQHDTHIGNLWKSMRGVQDWQLRAKTKVGIISTMTTACVSVVLWVAKAFIGTHN